MFDSFYKFTQVGIEKAHNKKYLKEIIIFSFRSRYNYYLNEVEVYADDIYIVKFYLKKDKRNPLKYHLLTNENKGSKVISTCIRIMLQIFERNPKASFGFIGANTVNPQNSYTEAKELTKRFRIYRLAMYALFGTETFAHYADVKHSAYLMVNNNVKDIDEVMINAKKMFENLFPDLTE